MLLNRIRTGCSEIDTRFSQLVSIGEQTYFQRNKLDQILINYPYYTYSNNYTYSLYARNYVLWNVDYRQYIPFLFSVQANLQQLLGYQIFVLVASNKAGRRAVVEPNRRLCFELY